MPPRRIVLSDDEEEDEILPSSAPETRKASTTQAQTQTQVKEFMTPSGSPERKRKTRSSSGNARSSKEKTRKAMNQMASGMGQGLAGLDVDSSEESESAFIDDDDESYGDYDDHEEEEDGRNAKHSASSSSKKKKKVAQFVIGLPANPPRSTNKPARRDDTYVSDAESYESEDMNEFILSKEEEEEEEEDRIRKESKARRKAKKERKRKKDMKRAAAAAMFDESVRKGGKSSAKKSPGKKRIIVLEDEDEDEDAVQQSSKSGKRQKVVSAESSEDEEEEQEADSVSSSDGEEDDDGGDEEEEEALDGPELYWQVDKMAAEEHELDHTMSMRQNFDEGEAVQVYIEYLCHCHMKPQFADKVLKSPREPTHARYLAAAKHVEDRICTVRESLVGSGAWSGKGKDFTWELQRRPFYTTDASSVDRLRESVESAGADYGICAACARQNKIAPNIVFLFGAEYDARAVWNRKQWHLEMPEGVFLHERHKEKRRGGDVEEEEEEEKEKEKDGDEDEEEEDDDGDQGEDEEEGYSDVEDAPQACQWWLRKWPGRLTAGKETSWELSGHCRGRTQLYHALLHYKLRLLLKVRDKLERLYGNVTELVSNREFCKGEADRFENLLDIATSKFGGKGMEDAAVRRIAGVWEDGRGAPSPEAAANRASERRRSSMSMLQWLSQTNKKGGDGGAAAKRDDNDDDFEGG